MARRKVRSRKGKYQKVDYCATCLLELERQEELLMRPDGTQQVTLLRVTCPKCGVKYSYTAADGRT